MPLYVTHKEKKRRIISVVLCLLLSIGAGVWIYFTYKKIDDIENGQREDSLMKLKKRLREELNKKKQNEDALIDFSEPVGWRIKYTDSADKYTAGNFIYTKALKDYLDKWVEELANRKITKYAKWSATAEEARDKPRLDIPQLFAELEGIYSDLKKNIDEAEKAKAESEKEEKKTNDEQKQEITKLASEIYGDNPKEWGGKVQEINALNGKLFQLQSQSTSTIDEMSKEYKAKNKEYDDLKNKDAQEIATIAKQADEMEDRYKIFTARLKEEEAKMEPAGVIKLVDKERHIAYVDLSSADKIWRGTKFKIFSLLRAGDKVIRGYAEVINVGEQYSKIAITKIIDDKNPPQAGDYIFNEYYERGKKRSFAFAGNLVGRLGVEQLEMRISKIGDEVKKDVGETTTYLVVGKGYEKTAEYKRAKELKVKIITERDLYDYLDLTF